MNRPLRTTALAFAAFMFGVGAVHAQRIAWTADGNCHDKDDWGSYAMMTLLLKDAGVGLVHSDINNHVPESIASWESQMRTSASGLGFAYIDCRPSMDGAVSHLRSQFSAPLTLCLAGPPEVLWRALQGVPSTTRRNVTVLSHSSPYNETSGPHTLSQCTGVNVVKIPNQNQRLNTKQNWGPWYWLRDSRKADLRWVYSRMRASGRADVSDSGMLFYLLYGKSTPTIADYRGALQ
jgi:hypothetical protein